MDNEEYDPIRTLSSYCRLINSNSPLDDVALIESRLDSESFRELIRLYCNNQNSNFDHANLCRTKIRECVTHVRDIRKQLIEKKERANSLKLVSGSTTAGAGMGALLGGVDTLFTGGLVSICVGVSIFSWGEIERKSLGRRIAELESLEETVKSLKEEFDER